MSDEIEPQPTPRDAFSTLDYYDGNKCMEAVEHMGIGRDFYRGQVIKYMWRLGRKGDPMPDALKAKAYIERLIHVLETEATIRGQ